LLTTETISLTSNISHPYPVSQYRTATSASRPYFFTSQHRPVHYYWNPKAYTEAVYTHKYPRDVPYGYYLSVKKELQLRPPITLPSYWHLFQTTNQFLNPEILILNKEGYWEQPFTTTSNYTLVNGEHIPLYYTPEQFANRQHLHNILFRQDALDAYETGIIHASALPLSNHQIKVIERYLEELGIERYTNPNLIPLRQNHDFIYPTFPAEHEYPYVGEDLEETLKLIPSPADSPIRYDTPCSPKSSVTRRSTPILPSPSPSTGTSKNLGALRRLSMARKATAQTAGYFARVSHTKRHLKRIRKDTRKWMTI
jgi:hypothetical protein